MRLNMRSFEAHLRFSLRYLDVSEWLTSVILMYVNDWRVSPWCMWMTDECHLDVREWLTSVILMYVNDWRVLVSSWCMWMTDECHLDVCESLTSVIFMYVNDWRVSILMYVNDWQVSSWCMWMIDECHLDVCEWLTSVRVLLRGISMFAIFNQRPPPPTVGFWRTFLQHTSANYKQVLCYV